jgi:hypothetical protein
MAQERDADAVAAQASIARIVAQRADVRNAEAQENATRVVATDLRTARIAPDGQGIAPPATVGDGRLARPTSVTPVAVLENASIA